MSKVYVVVQNYWDDSDTRTECRLFSSLETARKELEAKKQEIEKSWETSQDHIINGDITDKFVDIDNGFEVHELHYFLWGGRDWVFEYGYEIRKYDLRDVQRAYDSCNYKKDEDYIKDLTSVIDTDTYITVDFCCQNYGEDLDEDFEEDFE